jgi:phosphoribosyl-AMP cyclohydrolase
MTTFPAQPSDKNTIEEGAVFMPRFDASGLITAVVTDERDGVLLMVAHMNAEALRLTLDTGVAHYWSRSRNTLWKKGETSGNLQSVIELRTDCDQDASRFVLLAMAPPAIPDAAHASIGRWSLKMVKPH